MASLPSYVPRPVGRALNAALHAGLAVVDRVGEIAPGTRAAARFGSFGQGTSIGFPPATLMNTGAIHLGSDTLIGRHVTLSAGYGPLDERDLERTLVIGDRCVIGARCSFAAHELIEIGDGVWFGQDVFVCDASHGYRDPHMPIGEQFGAHAPVRIGSGTWIGHGAIVLPGTTIGCNVAVAAGSVVRGEIPDHSVVAGVPARVIRRLENGVGWVGAHGDVREVLDGRIGATG
ncbi:acyltransferase [Nocardioides acrostichi]|uniref:acyltransferase n=1 Tax=Nocardioides acrostichi TaxID=2784339 RepID=UPI002E2C06B3|nr:DapH/DapD/GlmU-related protein [Nocardioides acrostichi]